MLPGIDIFHRPARASLPGLLFVTLMAGCQSVGPMAAPQEDPFADAPPIERGLDAESLSTLLTAELAGQRGDYRRATQGYLEVAQRYDSVELVERAALAARFSEDRELLSETAERWQALAPESEAPARLLSTLALERGDWPDALEQRLRVMRRGGDGELTEFVENALAENADPAPLLVQLRDHLDHHGDLPDPQRHDAELATAMLEVAVGDIASAERRLERLVAEAPDLPDLWLTRARLAREAGDQRAARRAARRGLELAPDDARFILLLAQSELRLGNVDAAEARIDALLEKHTGNHDLRLALAQLYLEEGYPDPARRLLLPLIDEEETPPLAYLLLGAIAEQEGEIDNALLYYRQVPPGDNFLSARLRAAEMLIDDGRLLDARAFLRIERMRHDAHFTDLIALEVELLDREGLSAQADALLERELDRTPNDTQLLYLRAMRAWEDGDLEAMERDLGRILERDPDNAMVLNALGYTLADEGSEERLDEAREMIERAHRLDPDNPAILDSLGWVYFRLGDPERALPWLQRAYAAMPDQEVAAHLAEVLWALDRTEQARALVKEALERFDDRPAIDELLERIPELGVDPA